MSQTVATTQPEIEGLGTPEDDGWGQYPIDNILIRTEARTVFEVVRRMDKTYVLDPEFQRDFVWDTKKQSKLIESVLMRIPLPVFYLAEDEQGRMIVVDGLQRLTTFRRFLTGELKLDIGRQDMNGKHFADLPAKLQNRVEDCNLTFYVIDSKVPESVRLDIFERVNLGVPLSRQQMRNCLYQGPATRFLKSMAQNPKFLEATGNSFRTLDMRDREAINRYVAFRVLGVESYRGDMDDYLAEALKLLNKNANLIEELELELLAALECAICVFGKHAYRKYQVSQDNRTPINMGLWDVMSVGFSRYGFNRTKPQVDQLRSAFMSLQTNQEFVNAITIGTNSKKKVQARFALFGQLLESVLGPC